MSLDQAAHRGRTAAETEPPEASAEAESPEASAEAVSAVRLGLWISATRCFLTYVVAPAAGALGLFLGPAGMVLQVLGAVTATSGARTLWLLGHRARWVYAVVAAVVGIAALASIVQFVSGVVR